MNKKNHYAKIVSIVLFILVITGPVVTAQQTPAPLISVICGDTNNDEVIDIVDALRIAQFYIGLNPANFVSDVADVNQSGVIDIVDALLVAQFYVGLITDLACGNTLPELENAFEVIDFTSQDWYGGPMGSGGGTYFVAQLNVIMPSVDSIDGVWIEDRYYPPVVTNVTSPDSIPYVEGDELLMNLDYRWIPSTPELGIEASEEPPLGNGPDFTGAALIMFAINGEAKSYIVDTIRVLDPIAYP